MGLGDLIKGVGDAIASSFMGGITFFSDLLSPVYETFVIGYIIFLALFFLLLQALFIYTYFKMGQGVVFLWSKFKLFFKGAEEKFLDTLDIK